MYGSCGGCYFTTHTGEHFGNVAYVLGSACTQPGPGYYYVDPALTICNGATGAGPQTVSTAMVNPLPNVLGSHVFSIVIDGGVSIGYGSFLAFSTTSVVSNTQWQYVGVSFKVTGPDGQSGWTTLSIPKAKVSQLVTIAALGNLLPGSINQWKVTVFLDGAPQPAYIQYDDNNVYVSFPCHFSNHTIDVVFAPPGAPEATAFSSNSTAVSITLASASATGTSSVTASSSNGQAGSSGSATTTPGSSGSSNTSTVASASSSSSPASSSALSPDYALLVLAEVAVFLILFMAARKGPTE